MNALLVAAALAAAPLAPPVTPPLTPSEVDRIRHHLAGAEAFARSHDVSGMSEGQRANRERNLARLRAYRDAGRFPKNRDFPGERLPYFRDADGTLCAMAYLLWESGERALVERVVATRNNATVHELADEPGLAQWLEREGLSLEEAARIQPSYDFYDLSVVSSPGQVEPGACSPEIDLRVLWQWSGDPVDRTGAVGAPGTTVTFFADPACTTDLGTQTWRGTHRTAPLEAIDGHARFHLRETTPGPLRLSFQFQESMIEHTLQVGAPGTQPEPEPEPQPITTRPPEGDRLVPIPQGCAAAPGGAMLALLALGPALARARRRR